MPELDRDLILQAGKYITGANVHHVKTWIFCYETSQPGTPRSLRYEVLLRDFVSSNRQITLARTQIVAQRQQLMRLDQAIDDIEAMIERSHPSHSG